MSTEGDIQTVLASLVSGRCFPIIAPDETAKPYITYQVVSNIPETTLDGPTGTENRRLQIDVFDTTYGAVKTLEATIKSTMASAAIVNIPLSTGDLYEGDTQLYRVTMDYSIWTVPSS
jgi:hypothetical protein